MKITWLGHACFLLEAEDGTRLVTDPFEAGSYGGAVGYPPIEVRADVVTVSHDHADHNAVACVSGKPTVVARSEPRKLKGVSVRGVPSYHDRSHGSERGTNTMFVIEIDGVRVAHLGDLGHALSPQDVEALGPVDVLLVPVGGHFTIGPDEAKAAAGQVGARIVIPMHYKTDALGFPIQPVDDFARLMPRVERANATAIDVHAGDLTSEPTVVILAYHESAGGPP